MVLLTVAFATATHAQAALRFLARTAVDFTASSVVGGSGPEFARVELILAASDLNRMQTLLAGVSAIVIEERPQAPAA
jgi:hypothetical protein